MFQQKEIKPTIYEFKQHGIPLNALSRHALNVVHTLIKAGHTTYFVGGCIRDLLVNETPKDFDISTSAKPEEIKSLFRNCILVGKRFRLAHIKFGNQIIEVSTFRAGDPEADGLIIKDNLWGSPQEDVLRRDFTINGLFYDPIQEKIIDYTNGFLDIQNRYLQTIGDPQLRFKQDPVRMIRLLKILAKLPFDVDPKTLEALEICRYEIIKSSPARVFEELIKMLSSGRSQIFFKLIKDHQLLEILFPYMNKSFLLSEPLQKLTFQFLQELDNKIQKKQSYERHVMLSILLFPITHFNVKYKLKKNPHMKITGIFEYIRNFLGKFFADSFTKCSKKIFVLLTLSIQMQHRLTPLQPTKRHNFFNKKLLLHSKFPEALQLLEIRSLVQPQLKTIYSSWLKHYLALKKGKPSSNTN